MTEQHFEIFTASGLHVKSPSSISSLSQPSKKENSSSRSCLQALPTICFVAFIFLHIAEGINVSATGPFFPIEAPKKGVSQTWVGTITAFTMVNMCIFSLLLMFTISDKVKEVVFFLGVFLSAATCIGFGEAIVIEGKILFIAACITARALMGIGCACLWSAGAPILLPLFPKREARVFSFLELSVCFGQMIGPPIGSALYTLGGYKLPFRVAGSIEIFMGVVSLILLKILFSTSGQLKKSETRRQMKREIVSSRSVSMMSLAKCEENTKIKKAALKFISHPGILLITLPAIATHSQVGFFQVALAPYLLEVFGIDGKTSGNIFLLHAGFSALTCPLFGILVDKGFASKIFVICNIITGVAYFTLSVPGFITIAFEKFSLFFGLAVLGTASNGGFIPLYFLLEKIGVLGKIDNLRQIRLYLCAWMNFIYAVSSSVGQVVIGGVFLDHYSFYGSCMLLCVLSFLTVLASSAYLCKADLMGKLEYTQETEPLNQAIGKEDENDVKLLSKRKNSPKKDVLESLNDAPSII